MSIQAPPNYSSYTHADLLSRVTDLEAQLRALNSAHKTPLAPPPKKKAQKPAGYFDPSRYHTRFIALKFAYLGGNYNGFEHHTNNTTPLPTIEEVLWRALRKTRLIFPDFTKVGGNEEEVCWEGVEYSKCGRTDRGVSAFGQVVGLRVRSSRPKVKVRDGEAGSEHVDGITTGVSEVRLAKDSPMVHASAGAEDDSGGASTPEDPPAWDPIRDEHPYIQLLNRVLPSDIRILAWCPHPPPDFSARFSCKERRYRYFFTNPAYASAPGSSEGKLDINAMQQAAEKLEGLHDFRNFCKVDPSKQIVSFERRIFHAGIHSVRPTVPNSISGAEPAAEPELYYFEVRGSAFLWHQVRHIVAILFLVGQGYEQPSIVDQLLDTAVCLGKPVYDMADDRPLVLWDCVFPDLDNLAAGEQYSHQQAADRQSFTQGFENALNWVYVGDDAGGRDTAKRIIKGVDDAKYGRNGIMDELWALWRKRKIDEVLAGSLIDVVSRQGGKRRSLPNALSTANGTNGVEISDRIFDGSDRPKTVGTYVPLMQRKRLEAPEVVNARYAARKGLMPRSANGGGGEIDTDD